MHLRIQYVRTSKRHDKFFTHQLVKETIGKGKDKGYTPGTAAGWVGLQNVRPSFRLNRLRCRLQLVNDETIVCLSRFPPQEMLLAWLLARLLARGHTHVAILCGHWPGGASSLPAAV